MREWKKLPLKKKLRRAWHTVSDFVRFKVIGPGIMGRSGILGLWYWIRVHVWNRYHIINLKKHAPKCDYDWGWIDRDHAMYLACFHILCDFVENEIPYSQVDYVDNPEQAHFYSEAMDLYDWWKNGRVEEQRKKAELWDAACVRVKFPKNEGFVTHKNEIAYEKYRQYDDELEEKWDRQLERLMEIRGYLWT